MIDSYKSYLPTKSTIISLAHTARLLISSKIVNNSSTVPLDVGRSSLATSNIWPSSVSDMLKCLTRLRCRKMMSYYLWIMMPKKKCIENNIKIRRQVGTKKWKSPRNFARQLHYRWNHFHHKPTTFSISYNNYLSYYGI